MADEIPDKCPQFDEPIEIEPGKTCWHNRFTITEAQRVVTCRDCEAVLDPFTVLMEYANMDRRLSYTKKKAVEASKGLRELLAAEKLAKARLRNARKQLKKLGWPPEEPAT